MPNYDDWRTGATERDEDEHDDDADFCRCPECREERAYHASIREERDLEAARADGLIRED